MDSNFFELGGHSLKAVVMAAEIHKKINIKISLADVFKLKTIRKLSGFIKETVEKYTSIDLVEDKDYYALSSTQKRLYVLKQMDVSKTAYNIPAVFTLV